jgi:hypothetical protein
MTKQSNYPPKLLTTESGDITTNSLADLLEWFLSFDPKVALVRNPQVEEVFQWKQKDDADNGVETYPFENAESRFAIGIFQALGEHNSENKLHEWLSEVLQALGEAKQTNEEIAKTYDIEHEKSLVAQAERIPANIERRLYLTSCWLESLCTAEARFLGWIYQELYRKPYQPV